MHLPLQLTGSIGTQTRVAQGALLVLFAALGVVSIFQARQLLKASAGASPAGLRIQSIQTHLDGISTAIASYLKDHDAASLERVKTEGKETSRLLSEFKEDTVRGGNKSAYARLDKAHAQFRETTLNLLAFDHAVANSRHSLHEAAQDLTAYLNDPLESSIRPSQLNSGARLRAIRAAGAEAKIFSENPSAQDDPGSNRTRFRRAIATYEELSRGRRAAHWADKANTLFDRCAEISRNLQLTKFQKQGALDDYGEARKALDKILQKDRSSLVLGVRVRLVKQAFTSGMGYVVLTGLLLLAGTWLVLKNNRRTEAKVVRPLQEILQCVEAAASGDVSRAPNHWSQDEVGQLSQAVGRLISVLARSENLVYHLAALVESSGEAIISHTMDGTILSWNKGAQRIYGYSAEEVKGRSIAVLSYQNEGSDLMRNLERLRHGERIQPFETIHQARNGRPVRALVRVAAILDSTRKVIGASFVAQELTDTPAIPNRVSEHRQAV